MLKRISIFLISFVFFLSPLVAFASTKDATQTNTLTLSVPYTDTSSGSGNMSNTVSAPDLSEKPVVSVSRKAVGTMTISTTAIGTLTYRIYYSCAGGRLKVNLPLQLYSAYGLTGYSFDVIANRTTIYSSGTVNLASGGIYLINFDYDLPDGQYTYFDVVIKFPLKATAGTTASGNTKTVVTELGLAQGNYLFEIDDNETTGLLNGIIGWITNIYNGIIDLPGKIADALGTLFQLIVSAITDMRDMIVSALTELGQFIIDGLKGLFIPSDGYFDSVSADMQDWFDEHFGFITTFFDYVERILGMMLLRPTGTIHFPGVFWDGHTIIAEQDVKIIPDDFMFILPYIHFMGKVIIIGLLLKLCYAKVDNIIGADKYEIGG